MDKETDIKIHHFLRLIKKEFSNIEKVYLFGSYARGLHTEDSDIYIALIFNNLNDNTRFDIQVKLMLLAADIDTRIEPHPISYDDFIKENTFVREIKNTGIEMIA